MSVSAINWIKRYNNTYILEVILNEDPTKDMCSELYVHANNIWTIQWHLAPVSPTNLSQNLVLTINTWSSLNQSVSLRLNSRATYPSQLVKPSPGQ